MASGDLSYCLFVLGIQTKEKFYVRVYKIIMGEMKALTNVQKCSFEK